MKIRGLYIQASRVVAALSKKWVINPSWVWDVFEYECGIIKGQGCLASQEEIDRVESHICDKIMHSKA